jgi:type III restriction enzyme
MEAGGDLDDNFRKAAAAELERFRQELRTRGEHDKAANLTDADLLREVMKTVGRKGPSESPSVAWSWFDAISHA